MTKTNLRSDKIPYLCTDATQSRSVQIMADSNFIDTPYTADNNVKPAFLFCCFTGLRHSDLVKLTWGEIKQSPDGQFQIETTMKKTKHDVFIPLSENALSFLPERGNAKDTDRVFPKLPLQPATPTSASRPS